jgi:hypothetical protein
MKADANSSPNTSHAIDVSPDKRSTTDTPPQQNPPGI